MNRKEFMDRLRELLKDIPEEEKEEALAYYESYFDEAGVEEENKVIQELESPEKVAATIKEDLLGNLPISLQKSQKDSKQQKQESENSYQNSGPEFSYREKKEEYEGNDRRSNIVLWIIIAIVTFPIWIGILGAAIGILAAIFGVLFGGLVTLIAVSGGLLISGIVLVCIGFAGCFSGGVAVGMMLLGIGLILTAIGLVFLIGTIWVCAKGIPAICREINKLFRKGSFRRKERVQ
ncbi:MAG: hypothetical protein HFI37_03940 [Lachnospiraceae bacterium]|nr:hypothetical protein [Lachnospiraceae bacterium]